MAKTTKKIDKTTKVKHRFGNFELRLSDVKVEIEDVVHRLKKFTYNSGSYEYGFISYLLSDTIPTDDGVKKRTEKEMKEDLKKLEMLVYMLVYTSLIFSDAKFRTDYYSLMAEAVQREAPTSETSEEEDTKILEELKTEHEVKQILKDDLES